MQYDMILLSETSELHCHRPSLFAGSGGSTGAEMHVDAWCSHFWMVMLSGRKRWTLFSEEDGLRPVSDK